MERPIKRRAALALLGLPFALSLESSLAGCALRIPRPLKATDLTACVGGSAPAQDAQTPIGETLTNQDAARGAYDFTARLLQGCCEADGLSVTDGYLSTCKGSLSAQVFSAPFDETTREDINSWTSSKTDGMIEEIMDEMTSRSWRCCPRRVPGPVGSWALSMASPYGRSSSIPYRTSRSMRASRSSP